MITFKNLENPKKIFKKLINKILYIKKIQQKNPLKTLLKILKNVISPAKN